MFELIHNTEDRTKWDDVVTLFKVIRNVEKNVDVVHSQTCSMFGGMIGARDFVDIRIWEGR